MGIVHAILSATIPLYEAFCLFVMRNRDFVPGKEPKLGPPPVLPIYTGTPVPPQEPTGAAPAEETPLAMAPETATVPSQTGAEQPGDGQNQAPTEKTE